MELKHAKKPATPVSALRINCTVVELKPGEVSVYSGFLKVLIVPLWNWNDKTVSGLILRNGINCTVVELKLVDEDGKKYGISY